MPGKKKIFVFSSVHPWDDGRILYRQAFSLASEFNVELHANADFNHKEINGVHVYGLPPWNNLKDRLRHIRTLLYRALKSDADIYHFHDPELLLIAPVIKFVKRKPIIYDVHEHYPLIMMEKEYIPKFLRKVMSHLLNFIEMILIIFVDRIFYTTQMVGSRYLWFKKGKTFQVTNVPSATLFPEEPLPIRQRSKTAIFLGNMTAVRGMREIVTAFRTIIDKHPDYKLILAGKFFHPGFREELINLVNSYRLDEHVELQSEFNYLEIQKILKDVRIGYITYLSYPNNIACMPNKIFEYMGAGLNIVASHFRNYEEVLIEDECGLTVVPERVQEIAEATLRFIDDEDFAEKMAKSARRQFIEKYNWEKEEKRFLNYYHLL